MAKALSDEDRLKLKYREILEGVENASYPDSAAREAAIMLSFDTTKRNARD